jgi:uncharacterized RDD family membrane protein YckC
MSGTDRARSRRFITPEGVALKLRLADGVERVAAVLLDFGAMLLALVAVSLLSALGLKLGGSVTPVIWLLGAFLLRNFYFVGFELGMRAATPGKRALGLRVAARDGGRLTADAVLARNLMREIELFLPITLLAAARTELGVAVALAGLGWSLCFALFPLFNADRLRLGDLIAGTWVVAAPRAVLAPDVAKAGATGLSFTPEQADSYGEKELFVLEDVLRARHAATMAEVAGLIRRRIGWHGGVADDAAFLEAYYAAARRRLEQRMLLGRRRRDKQDDGAGAPLAAQPGPRDPRGGR